MGFFDDLADKIGLSSKSLGINTAEDKAAREAEARRLAEIEADKARIQSMPRSIKQLDELNIPNAEQIGQEAVEPSIWDSTRHNATAAWQALTKAAGSPIGQAVMASGAPILGGILGSKAAADDYSAAEATQRQAADLAGTYEATGPSQMALIQDNPEMLALRQQALKGIQERASMGLTPEDQAMLRQAQNKANQQFQARQAQVQSDMGRRGLGNSGLNLAAQMSGNQAALQNQSESADRQAALSFQAKQNALANLGTQSANALTQDFSRDEARASAADKFNLENIQNKMNAARQKATMMNPIAASQAQKGARTADLYNKVGGGIGQGINVYQQNKQKPQG